MQSGPDSNPLGLAVTWWDPTDLIELHEAGDLARLVRIRESMDADGWCGGPLVVLHGRCMTGSHRLAAAREIRLRGIGQLDEIPTVDAVELWAALGLDVESYDGDLDAAITALPPETADTYGLDH